jgi:hypothetical protein
VGPRAGTKKITHVFAVCQNPSKFLEIVVTQSSLIQRLGFDRMGIDGLWQWLGAQVSGRVCVIIRMYDQLVHNLGVGRYLPIVGTYFASPTVAIGRYCLTLKARCGKPIPSVS